MNYKVSNKARLDLINIWEYTAENWSNIQADKYYQILVGKFSEISLRPDMGRSYNDLKKGYWGLLVQSHIIFYKFQNPNCIKIIRILHRKMDLKSRIRE